ncbi:glucose-6-phosphate isomerase [Coxiella burnetii]|uniref:glucose-6-phosphate isomerase n=1 Tax=Coxiella burnetii TaxID=777 RepID=UPI0005927F3E|nr:glucose-6-phosphate isomerase [Coxiella burnetii]
MSLVESPPWQALKSKYQELSSLHMRDFFAQDKKRGTRLSLEAAGLYFDYSKNRVDEKTIDLLCESANACNLPLRIEQLFSGKLTNESGEMVGFHTALRQVNNFSFKTNNNAIQEIHASWEKIKKLSIRIREGDYKGFTNKSITDIVNIGIGGSSLGPQMAYNALKPYVKAPLRCHFISNLDDTDFYETVRTLNPETTLFIITSKTFTTKETLENARRATEWLMQAAKKENLIQTHFMAVTAAPEKAHEFGIQKDNIFMLWPWVGGRFSVWSAAGLSLAIAIGWEEFFEFLRGAHAMDTHFRQAEFNKNMPILLALLSIWYINFFHAKTQAIIPYSQRLVYLPDYLTQLHMESLGKSVQLDGSAVHWQTGAVVWGDLGTNSQHSFHQLFSQGTMVIPVDFIAVLKNSRESHWQLPLIANCLGQSQTLMEGYDKEGVMRDLINQGIEHEKAEKLATYRLIRGNNPSNTIILEELNPYSLGSLLALYEHKVYVQSVIWNINPFDQWGVERGKHLAKDILQALQAETDQSSFDSSTERLINYVLKIKGNRP